MPHAARGLAVLRHRDFTLFLGARFCSSIAAQMIVVAVGWQVYQMTGRVFDLGMIGLSQFLPFLCLVLFAGHAADRYDRRVILIVCNCVQLLCSGLLLAFAIGALAATWPIFAVLALLGVARAFQMPTGQSLMPNLVPAATLGSAIAISSSTFQVATIVGPSIGGALYAAADHSAGIGGGAGLVYAAAGVLLIAAMTMIGLIRGRRTGGKPVAASWASLLEGLRFVWRRRTVLGAISLDLFAVLFGGATALLPAFTRDVLHAGPEVFGLLRTAPGVGAGLTALVLAFKPIQRRVGVTMFSGVALFGAMTVVFGLTQHFWVALIALAVLGAGDMQSVFIRSVLVQLETPDEIRGRVSAVNAVFIGASNELGEFESGLTAAWMGLVPAIVAGGVATLGFTLLWAFWLFPPLWRLQSFGELKENCETPA
jgi:MFS family permease